MASIEDETTYLRPTDPAETMHTYDLKRRKQRNSKASKTILYIALICENQKTKRRS